MKKLFFLIFILLVIFVNAFKAMAEGTKEIMPDSTKGAAFYIYPTTLSGSYLNCPAEQRIKFSIKNNLTEYLYYGFQARDRSATPVIPTKLYYRILDSNGVVVVTPRLVPRTTATTGYINYYSQAVAGPNIGGATPAGYTPIVYDPVKNGDFWIEIYVSNDGGVTQVVSATLLVYFDLTVATAGNIKYTGRVHCQKWAFITYKHSKPPAADAYTGDPVYAYLGDMFTYTPDSVVCKIDFQPLFRPYAFNLAVNKYGITDNGNFTVDRMSVYSGGTPPALANGYKIFLNQPDTSLFRNSPVPASPTFKIISGCPGFWIIGFEVQTTGDMQLLLDLNGVAGYQPGTKDRILYAYDVKPVYNTLFWDGRDGLGNIVSTGVNSNFYLTLLRGRTNVPLYDAEINSNGLAVQGILPQAMNARLYWCDSAISSATNTACPAAPSGTENSDNNITGKGIDNSVTGSVGPSHAWDGFGANLTVPAPTGGGGSITLTANLCDDFGNARTINTWFWPATSAISNFNVTIPKSCVILPVKLLSFTVNKQGTAAGLHWVAADEVNLSKYVVEKSTNGINFTDISTVAVKTALQNDYYLSDDLQNTVSKNIYYRLRMVAEDGTFKYSNIESLNLNNGVNKKTAVYPNPVTDKVTVSINAAVLSNAQLILINNAGQVVYKQNEKLIKGDNYCTINNLQNLAKGIYTLQIVTDNDVVSTKIYKF